MTHSRAVDEPNWIFHTHSRLTQWPSTVFAAVLGASITPLIFTDGVNPQAGRDSRVDKILEVWSAGFHLGVLLYSHNEEKYL